MKKQKTVTPAQALVSRLHCYTMRSPGSPPQADMVEVEKVLRPSTSKVLYNLYTGRDEEGF